LRIPLRIRSYELSAATEPSETIVANRTVLKRHGTPTLLAALNVREGKVIGQCMKRHRHQEFIRF